MNTQKIDFAGVMFSPEYRAELKAAIDACLKLSPEGDCYTGPHGPIGEWNVSQVTDMNSMFADSSGTKSFNQELSKWDVDKVTSMDNMFSGANAFNQDLS